MRTLACQAEICVLVQIQVALVFGRAEGGCMGLPPFAAQVLGYHPRKRFLDCICKILQSSAFLAGK